MKRLAADTRGKPFSIRDVSRETFVFATSSDKCSKTREKDPEDDSTKMAVS